LIAVPWAARAYQVPPISTPASLFGDWKRHVSENAEICLGRPDQPGAVALFEWFEPHRWVRQCRCVKLHVCSSRAGDLAWD
jgi:hypothetical protein